VAAKFAGPNAEPMPLSASCFAPPQAREQVRHVPREYCPTPMLFFRERRADA
jgi:hypothetical protein